MRQSALAPQRVLATNNSAMFLYGLSAMLIGPTLPGMIREFSLSLGAGGFIGSMQNAGGFLGSLAALWIADRLSRPRTIVVSFALLGGALLAVGLSNAYAMLIAIIATTGFFIRTLDVMLNAHTGDVAGLEARRVAGRDAAAGAGRSMSTLHLFFSIGAFLGPIVARGVMEAGTGWDAVYRWIGIGYLAVALAASPWLLRFVRTSAEPPARSAVSGPTDAAEAAPVPPNAWRMVVLLGATLFFYAVHQIGVSSWVPYFLETERGASSNVASLGLSFYWVGIIAGRFLSARTVERLGVWRLLVAGLLIAAVTTTAAALVPGVWLATAFYALAGLTSGATIPLAYSAAYDVLPARRGTITATMSIIMLSGRFLAPWVIGTVGDRATLVLGMTIPGVALVIAGLLAAAAVVLTPPREPAA